MRAGGSPKEAAWRRQFPSPVVARGSSFLQLVHMVDHQFRRPAHTHAIRQKKIFLWEQNIIHKDVVLTQGRAKQIGKFFNPCLAKDLTGNTDEENASK